MRVAIFTETYLPLVNGVVTHIKTLKEGLEALGHQVLVVTADANVKKHTTSNDIMYCPAIRLKKIYNYDVASPISIDRVKLVKEFNPDIIHIHNEFGIGFSGLMMSKLLKIPLVYTLHTMYDDYVYYIANKHFCKFVTSATHKYAKILGNAASAITGPSRKVEEYFKNCGVSKEVSVIPNSVEVDIFDRSKVSQEEIDAIREKYGFSKDDFVFCFCGRMGTEKNIPVLLDFVAQTIKPDDRIKLLLIGGGPSIDDFKKQTEDLGITDIVKFTDRVEHLDIVPYYGACDAYITASLSECHSISMLEGESMGMPVLTLLDELNADQIIEGTSGYTYRDAEEMYHYMKMLRDMPKDEFEEFRRRTREAVVAASSENLAEHILSIYEAVIEENNLKKEYRENRKNLKSDLAKLEKEEKKTAKKTATAEKQAENKEKKLAVKAEKEAEKLEKKSVAAQKQAEAKEKKLAQKAEKGEKKSSSGTKEKRSSTKTGKSKSSSSASKKKTKSTTKKKADSSEKKGTSKKSTAKKTVKK